MKIFFTFLLGFVLIFSMFKTDSGYTVEKKGKLMKSDVSFDFNQNHFVLGFKNIEAGQALYELVPQGETVDNWTKLITIIRDTSLNGKATKVNLDAISEATLSGFKEKGAFVYNTFTYNDPKDKNITMNVMTVVFPGKTAAEIDIKKIFLSSDGNIIANTYGVRVSGTDDKDISAKVNAYLQTTNDIGMKLIQTTFPTPWENL